MRKFFILGAAIVVSVAMLLTSCKKEEVNNNGNNGNTENSGEGSGSGGDEGELTPNQEYPSTAVVLPQAVTDIDGNSYDAVQIGNQVWMAENLRTTKYADGTTIPMGSTNSETEPYRYAPGPNQSNEENMDNVARYGYLYNWPAVMHGASSSEANPSGVQGICPDGWHVPSDAEWTQLIDYMKTQPEYTASGNADHLAKALAATWGWNSSNETDAVGNDLNANNATGFSALPAGTCWGSFGGFGIVAHFWSCRESDGYAMNRNLHNQFPMVFGGYYDRFNGFSVRCVRD